jgi:hypothetical protein
MERKPSIRFGYSGVYGLMVFLILQMAATSSVLASEAIGYVKTLEGDHHTLTDTDGNARPVSVGSALFVGDTVRTGKETALGLTLKDDTIMSIGPETELTLEAYLFKPAQGELRLGSRMNKGTLQFVSGQIARLRPEAVDVQTPAGTIGVRGTHFALKVTP